MRLKEQFQFGETTASNDIYINHSMSCANGALSIEGGKRVHARTDARFPIFVFNGSLKDSRATGGGVPRSMRYGWVQGGVGLENPPPLNLRIIPILIANQSGY